MIHCVDASDSGLQIRFFYPELLHPAFGVFRAIVKDSTDTETGNSAVVFLDSDDEVPAVSVIPSLIDVSCIPMLVRSSMNKL
jgi:hypothetical protein